MDYYYGRRISSVRGQVRGNGASTSRLPSGGSQVPPLSWRAGRSVRARRSGRGVWLTSGYAWQRACGAERAKVSGRAVARARRCYRRPKASKVGSGRPGPPLQWPDGDVAARVRAFAISAGTFRRIALANALMLLVIVVERRDRAPDRVRARLPELAGLRGATKLPARDPLPADRVLEPRSSPAHDPARRSSPGSSRCRRRARRSVDAPRRARDVPRDARAGAARRDHGLLRPQPVARARRTSCSRS